MKLYYLHRQHPHQRYILSKTRLHDGENIGPFATWAEAKAECDRLNALVVKPPRKQGRPAKGGWVRFEMRLNSEIHQRLTACAEKAGEDKTAIVERILDVGLPILKMTAKQEENAKKFFTMLAEHGITKAIVVSPPEGGSLKAKIETDGELSMIDSRDGKRKKIQ